MHDFAPLGDPARHLDADTLEAAWNALPAPPTDAGTVAHLVARGTEGRQEPTTARLQVDQPFPGDKWKPRKKGTLDQITLMRADVGRLIANGQSLALFGDNLIVDLDLSTANLPAGTQLRVGTALLEITPEPHTGCHQYKQRFGGPALALTARKELRDVHLRGVHARVLEDGDVSLGDPVAVVRRPLDPLTFGEDQQCFGCGPHNHAGMQLRFFTEGDEVVTTFSAREGWDGAPGIVHGGLQATLADEIGAWTLVGKLGCFGFTTTANLRWMRPARSRLPIEARGRITKVDGARATVRVKLLQEGRPVMQGELTYFMATIEEAERTLDQPLPEAWHRLARQPR